MFTNNSLATSIGWVSTCLLAGGVSTMFSESTRMVWMSWGCFGLVSAVGLEITARVRERMRTSNLSVTAARRFERDMRLETESKQANAAIREVVSRLLKRPELPVAGPRSRKERFSCDLGVVLDLCQVHQRTTSADGTRTHTARITNLSESGFELTLTEQLPHKWMTMTVETPIGEQTTMLGELLWSNQLPDGSFVAGGRFLDVAAAESE
jgi:hypothetical protein